MLSAAFLHTLGSFIFLHFREDYGRWQLVLWVFLGCVLRDFLMRSFAAGRQQQ
jgi:hypothetical protein